uniref:Uncharacterized protein n=1 Tax=viral metagenome TaxID=1070528 RepID=A0A6M3IHN4_9ZZZZ
MGDEDIQYVGAQSEGSAEMTPLYVTLGALILISGLIWVVYRLAKNKGERDERNERLRIAVEKARKDRKVAAKHYVDNPLDRMRKLSNK